MLLRNRTVIGIDWGIWAMHARAEQRALLDDLLAMVEAGTLDPVLPTEYPLDDVAGALEDLLGRRTVGKIALVPNPMPARCDGDPRRTGVLDHDPAARADDGDLVVEVADHGLARGVHQVTVVHRPVLDSQTCFARLG